MYTGDSRIWEVCPDCNETELGGMFEPNLGNGICKHCEGDGTDHTPITSEIVEMITDDEGTCDYCSGTGQCQTCGGEGRVKINRDNDEDDDED